MTQIIVHPLVIMNIADHQARQVAEIGKYDPKNPPRVLGAVFGVQVNQKVEIMSSLELPYSFDDEKQIRIDDDAFAEDTDLYKQIYPEHELLGWYATSSRIESVDMPFHKRFTEYNESPLYLRMDPKVRTDAKALPVSVYRSELRQEKNTNRTVFVELTYTVVSDPAERLTTDHIIQDKDIPTKGSAAVPAYDELKNALLALRARIAVLVDYLDHIEKGKEAANLQILRSIESVCNRIPLNTNDKFSEDFYDEMSNGMMMTYLASMSKAAVKVNDMLDLYDNMMDGGRGGPRRMRGKMPY
mmetsp:Transcript_19118/g.30400  ORF Transcript_19118/g.30400 Transcript_19118/m.30400 type:complete len:300 (-) Transcript_19118:126-1025(-)|eukprot:CAMPEP_0202712462 /NCGR_PEP_ID=MMETSP1385-20130828/40783_1 /ASSEMBLY_ACC=CAM_ASM_000861 /TAXON_ID=933848 /ORGANISM="Elphidium margaritaceum" /LENGTH=299 /DNA_ID=CAMNT_0049372509 /DNA_START=30 /DNA_END=929 /DNA_ORIENTATION=+